MRTRRLLMALVLLLAVMPPGTADAGAGRWTGNGPFGGAVGDIATHPTRSDIALSGSHGAGVFRSTDGGRRWQRMAGLPADSLVFDIAFAPSDPSVVFLTTYADGVFKSTDSGRTWRAAGTPHFGTLVAVAVHPANPAIVLINSGSDMFRSTDGGQTWVRIVHHTNSNLWANSITFAPSNPNRVYAVGPVLLVSDDAGQTWADAGGTTSMYALAVHPGNADVLYVGSSAGVSKSVDGGKTFTQIMPVPVLDEVTDLALDPHNPQRLYAGTYYSGLYRLTGGGADAAHWDQGLPRQRVITVATLRSGDLLAGLAHDGVFRRGVDAPQWIRSTSGFRGSRITALAVAASNGSIVYAGTYAQGVARSRDAGGSWRWRGLQGRIVEGLAVHPSAARTVYAGTDRGVHRSTNGGRTWRRVLRANGHGITDVALAQSRPRVVYASTFEGGLWRSADEGATWRLTGLNTSEAVLSLAVHPNRPNTLYAGTRYSTVIKSTDGGTTWKRGAGLAVHFDPTDIAIDPQQPRRVFAMISADSGGGVFRSLDGGASWRRMAGGTEPESGGSIVIDQQRPSRMFAGAPGFTRPGVFRSTDGGRSWALMTNGLTTRWTTDLALSPSGQKLYAGTAAYGMESGGSVFNFRFE